MKQLLFWMVLIVGIVALIVSCAKKDDDTTATATTSTCTASTTASGTIAGLDNMTGTYSMSVYGLEPTGGCIDNSTAIATFTAVLPSGTLGFKNQQIVTSSTSFTDSWQYYSDTSCSTSTGYLNYGFTSVSVKDNVTGLTAGSNPTRPTIATKVTYAYSCLAAKGEADNATTYLNNLGIGTFTKGTELTLTGGGTVYKNIWATTDNVSGSTKNWFWIGSKSSSSYPSDWASGNSMSFK